MKAAARRWSWAQCMSAPPVPTARRWPARDHVVTFDGHGGVAVPASAPLLSDPVAMNVEALQKLVISIHMPGPFTRTGHSLYQYVAGQPGDQTAAGTLPVRASCACPHW